MLQFGWILKGLVYAIIGGVACQASAQDKAKINGADISPQVSYTAENCIVHLMARSCISSLECKYLLTYEHVKLFQNQGR